MTLDVVGWLAALLTLTAFAMRTMLPLRITAIASNIAFITYGGLAGFYPAFALHCILLPFNIYRLVEIHRLTKKVETAAGGELSVDWIKPVMAPKRFKAGEVVFRKGDVADRLYFLVDGRIKLTEIDKEIGAGSLFGEVAFFVPDRRRTLSVECVTDCTVGVVDETDIKKIYFQSPEFGFCLIRLIAARLAENLVYLETMPNGAEAEGDGAVVAAEG